LLLDSHALLWYGLNDQRLSATARSLIADPGNDILVSPASFWEIAIKISLKKFTLQQPYEDFIDACLNKYGFIAVPIEPKHTSRLISLPFHHKDPFERLLVAQALVENVPMVSQDPSLDAYGVQRLW
jgi:PIN domain nuclease of toxin-antitoxin system